MQLTNNMMSDKEIFENIDLKVKDIADLVKTTPATVYRWRSGEMKMNDLARSILLDYMAEKGKPIPSNKTISLLWSDTPITLFDWSSFLSHQKITQKELAEKLDVKQPYISQLKREYEKGRPVPDGVLDKLRDVYEDEIEPFLHERRVKAKKDGTVIDMYSTMRPYYDIDFFGSPGAELLDPAGNMEPDNYISVPHFTDVDFYTRVTGDSMYPKYRHGDIIACKSIDTSAFFAFYEPYAIVTRTNNQRLIKYIHPHPDDSNKLLLVSYDSDKFPPQPIDRDEVLKLFQIKGKIELWSFL